MAYNYCRGAIEDSDLHVYESCLNFTADETEHYVRSCVEDIKVTVLVIELCLQSVINMLLILNF